MAGRANSKVPPKADSGLSESILEFCASSRESDLMTAPEGIALLVALEKELPPEYGQGFVPDDLYEELVRRSRSAKDPVRLQNRLYWSEMARLIEAYSVLSTWRGARILRPAIRLLNEGELLVPAVAARSLLELSAYVLRTANDVREMVEGALSLPADHVVTVGEGRREGKNLEELLVLAIWGRRYGEPPPHLKQWNTESPLKYLAKRGKVPAIMDIYEFLCDIAHPSLMGHEIFMTGEGEIRSSGLVVHRFRPDADTAITTKVKGYVLRALAHGSVMTRNGVMLQQDAVKKIMARWVG